MKDSNNCNSIIQIYYYGQVNSATKYNTLIYNGYIIFNKKVTLVDEEVSIFKIIKCISILISTNNNLSVTHIKNY